MHCKKSLDFREPDGLRLNLDPFSMTENKIIFSVESN